MMGELDAEEIEEVLRTEILGRVGFVANDRPYIVPISYVYDGGYVYAHSGEGLKLRAMRDNPFVCFEVEQIRSMTNWRTVVGHGSFEQLTSDDEERAMPLVTTRLARIATSASARLAQQEEIHDREGFLRPVLFRIRMRDKTGRFELR